MLSMGTFGPAQARRHRAWLRNLANPGSPAAGHPSSLARVLLSLRAQQPGASSLAAARGPNAGDADLPTSGTPRTGHPSQNAAEAAGGRARRRLQSSRPAAQPQQNSDASASEAGPSEGSSNAGAASPVPGGDRHERGRSEGAQPRRPASKPRPASNRRSARVSGDKGRSSGNGSTGVAQDAAERASDATSGPSPSSSGRGPASQQRGRGSGKNSRRAPPTGDSTTVSAAKPEAGGAAAGGRALKPRVRGRSKSADPPQARGEGSRTTSQDGGARRGSGRPSTSSQDGRGNGRGAAAGASGAGGGRGKGERSGSRTVREEAERGRRAVGPAKGPGAVGTFASAGGRAAAAAGGQQRRAVGDRQPGGRGWAAAGPGTAHGFRPGTSSGKGWGGGSAPHTSTAGERSAEARAAAPITDDTLGARWLTPHRRLVTTLAGIAAKQPPPGDGRGRDRTTETVAAVVDALTSTQAHRVAAALGRLSAATPAVLAAAEGDKAALAEAARAAEAAAAAAAAAGRPPRDKLPAAEAPADAASARQEAAGVQAEAEAPPEEAVGRGADEPPALWPLTAPSLRRLAFPTIHWAARVRAMAPQVPAGGPFAPATFRDSKPAVAGASAVVLEAVSCTLLDHGVVTVRQAITQLRPALRAAAGTDPRHNPPPPHLHTGDRASSAAVQALAHADSLTAVPFQLRSLISSTILQQVPYMSAPEVAALLTAFGALASAPDAQLGDALALRAAKLLWEALSYDSKARIATRSSAAALAPPSQLEPEGEVEPWWEAKEWAVPDPAADLDPAAAAAAPLPPPRRRSELPPPLVALLMLLLTLVLPGRLSKLRVRHVMWEHFIDLASLPLVPPPPPPPPPPTATTTAEPTAAGVEATAESSAPEVAAATVVAPAATVVRSAALVAAAAAVRRVEGDAPPRPKYVSADGRPKEDDPRVLQRREQERVRREAEARALQGLTPLALAALLMAADRLQLLIAGTLAEEDALEALSLAAPELGAGRCLRWLQAYAGDRTALSSHVLQRFLAVIWKAAAAGELAGVQAVEALRLLADQSYNPTKDELAALLGFIFRDIRSHARQLAATAAAAAGGAEGTDAEPDQPPVYLNEPALAAAAHVPGYSSEELAGLAGAIAAELPRFRLDWAPAGTLPALRSALARFAASGGQDPADVAHAWRALVHRRKLPEDAALTSADSADDFIEAARRELLRSAGPLGLGASVLEAVLELPDEAPKRRAGGPTGARLGPS
ncbi:hypothetical protein HYH03_017105 [Edaphochlamys debaryana]|uniref:Uncharacterized protein n=1 Tax=Edaphochlamys debaryana TaxID=47281 RepID=A0A835XKT7_9CHLO|nr:hypothetical protein HYH03_017105 [Edaphochlamys debaryana]|eukprot:KAG2484086.1 hypothetical protein HYH03_017105 [Edaphochlamys debaryana]